MMLFCCDDVAGAFFFWCFNCICLVKCGKEFNGQRAHSNLLAYAFHSLAPSVFANIYRAIYAQNPSLCHSDNKIVNQVLAFDDYKMSMISMIERRQWVKRRTN